MSSKPKTSESGEAKSDDSTDSPQHQQVRGDGRVEWLCAHGVGHTMFVQLPSPNRVFTSPWDEPASYVHGCDGCCGRWKETLARV